MVSSDIKETDFFDFTLVAGYDNTFVSVPMYEPPTTPQDNDQSVVEAWLLVEF